MSRQHSSKTERMGRADIRNRLNAGSGWAVPDAPRASARRKAVTDLLARRATLARSLRLLGQFCYEQRDPARFYGALAADTAAMVTDLWRAINGPPPAG